MTDPRLTDQRLAKTDTRLQGAALTLKEEKTYFSNAAHHGELCIRRIVPCALVKVAKD
jgi:hypothetical protein